MLKRDSSSPSEQLTDVSDTAAEAPPVTSDDSFTYTFSPGRSPFTGTLLAHCKTKEAKFDKGRVDLEDQTTFARHSEEVEESLIPAKLLWEEITGAKSRQSYLHADAGLLSAPHIAGTCLLLLGESFMTRTNFMNDAGRVMGTLSLYEGGLRVTSIAVLTDFKYNQAMLGGRYETINDVRTEVPGLTDMWPTYASYVDPGNDASPPLVEMFLDGKLQIQFSHRYVFANSPQRPDVYEWRRRLDSYVLGHNIDEVEVLSLVNLAEAYSKKLEERDGASPDLVSSMASEGSLLSRSRDTKPKKTFRDSIDELGDRLSTIASPAKPAPAPRFTDKNLALPDLQVFANMQGLRDHLSQDNQINSCSTIFSDKQDSGRVGCLNFESNTLIFPPEIMQCATQTIQNIRADLFLRRVRLAIIISCLQDANLPLWQYNENKIGLCETLLNDLEHPLIPSDQAQTIASIKSMRDNPATAFDFGTLIDVANHLFEQAQTKANDLIVYCKNLKTRSPAMIWKTTKNLLKKTDLVEQLSALADHQNCKDLTQFSRICGQNLEVTFDNRQQFEKLLTQRRNKAFPSVVEEIIALINQIITNTTKPYRQKFLEPITLEEMRVSENFDPFLMYTITHILQPRQELIEKIKQLEKLNAYYILLKNCGAWNAALKAQLENAINALQQDQSIKAIEETIKEQVLNLPYPYLQVLNKELNLKRQGYRSKVIDDYSEGLYLKIAETSQARHDDAGVEVQQYFDQRYHDAINLPHGFHSFDKATKSYIEKKTVAVEEALGNYLIALFFRHFYVGLLFRDYLLCTPQEGNCRVFLYSDFARAESPWASVSANVDLIKAALIKKIQQPLTGDEAATAVYRTTSGVYIQDLEYKLQELSLSSSLKQDYVDFISLCVWISALVNRDSFSPDEIKSIEQKITQILGKYSNASNEVFTVSLLEIMNQAWQAYLGYESISQRASDEWLTESDNCEKIQELLNAGQRLFTSCDNSAATKKTIWLNAAFQFCYKIEASLKDSSRRSGRVSNTNRLLSDNRRSFIFQILVMVLTNQNLSTWQRERLKEFKKELVKHHQIRDLALGNIVELMSDATGSKKHFIGSQVPDLIFYSDQCEIFADPSFPKKVNDELFSPVQNEPLTIDKFIRNLLEALTYVVALVRNEQYRVFLPYIMEPLFTSFSVIYYYLTTVDKPVPKNATALWYKCIVKIKEIVKEDSENDKSTPDSSGKYAEFATVWEEILSAVVRHCPDISFDGDMIELNSQVNLYHFIAAHEVCLKLKKAGFKIDSAIKEIASQWYKVTNYAVNSREIRSLNMILMDRYHVTYERNHDDKRGRLSAFFMRNVKQVLRLGRVFFVLVSDDFPQSYSKHISRSTGLIGLDIIADDLQKIYTIRLEGWRSDNNYPAPFNYPVVLVYRPARWFPLRRVNEVDYNCIEIYEESGSIMRRNCSARDSSWISRASAVLSVAHETRLPSLLEKVISDNHVLSPPTLSSHIFPKFFAILLDLLDESMRVMKLHYTSSPPLSCALLCPDDAMYNDPRALIACSENQLIGLFFLGLIYRELEQQEKGQKSVAGNWFLNLPSFFGNADNVARLGKHGIVKSGILKTQYGSSGRQEDPIATELRELDKKLSSRQRERGDTVQGSYCTWFKQTKYLSPNNKGTSSASSSGNNSATSLALLSSDSKETSNVWHEHKATRR